MAVNPITSNDLTIDLSDLLKLSVSDRVQAAQDDGIAQALMSALTPIQMAKAFPDYYRKELPDISNFILGNRYLDRVGAGGFDQRGGGDYGSTMPRYGGETALPSDRQPGGKKLSVDEMKAKLLEKGIDVEKTYETIGTGIAADDERIGYLKNASADELSKMGFEQYDGPDGKKMIRVLPTEASQMSDEAAVAEYKKTFSDGNFTPRERATLDFIAHREGAKNADIIFGDTGNIPGSGKYSRMLGLDKRPLSDHTINEVLALQKQMTRITGADGVAGGVGTSAVGTGQMVRKTLIGNLKSLGIPEDQWDKIKFDKNLQERLTLENFKTSGIGNPNADPSTWNLRQLGNQYESLDTAKGHSTITQNEADSIRNSSNIRPEPNENITPEQARQKLDEAERQARFGAETEYIYAQPSPTSSDAAIQPSTATQQLFIGDSIAEGMKTASKGEGNTKVGRKPGEILSEMEKMGPDYFKGKEVVLSTGLSNNTQDLDSVRKQMEFLKQSGANVKIAGMSNSREDLAPGNQQLQDLANEYGYQFMGGFDAGKDKIHPTNYSEYLAASTPTEPVKTYQHGGSPTLQDDEDLMAVGPDGKPRFKFNSGEGLYVKPEANEYAEDKIDELSGRIDQMFNNQKPERRELPSRQSKAPENWAKKVSAEYHPAGSQQRAFNRAQFRPEGRHVGDRGSPNITS